MKISYYIQATKNSSVFLKHRELFRAEDLLYTNTLNENEVKSIWADETKLNQSRTNYTEKKCSKEIKSVRGKGTLLRCLLSLVHREHCQTFVKMWSRIRIMTQMT